MNRQKINYLVDFLLLVSVLISFASVKLVRNRDLHSLVGNLFFFLVVVHFALHWQMIVAMTKNIFRRQSNAGSAPAQTEISNK